MARRSRRGHAVDVGAGMAANIRGVGGKVNDLTARAGPAIIRRAGASTSCRSLRGRRPDAATCRPLRLRRRPRRHREHPRRGLAADLRRPGLGGRRTRSARAAEVDDRLFLAEVFAERKIEGGDVEGWVRRKQAPDRGHAGRLAPDLPGGRRSWSVGSPGASAWGSSRRPGARTSTSCWRPPGWPMPSRSSWARKTSRR